MKKEKMTTGEIAQLFFEVLTFLCAIAGIYIGSLNNADDKANTSINIVTSQSTKNVNSIKQDSENKNSNINNNTVNPVIMISPAASTTDLRSRMDKIVMKKDYSVFNNFYTENGDDLTIEDFKHIVAQLNGDYESTVKEMYLMLLFSRKNFVADQYVANNLVGSTDPIKHRSIQYISKNTLGDYKDVLCNYILKSEPKIDSFILLNLAFIDLFQTGEKATELCNWNELIDKIANDPDFVVKMETMFRTLTDNKLKYFEDTYLQKKLNSFGSKK
ncbi:MAG: hypothetical protein JNL49_05915 [Bacteroidia bacterium]|nr:hypothetical protein [Bacteroidia bacterium]